MRPSNSAPSNFHKALPPAPPPSLLKFIKSTPMSPTGSEITHVSDTALMVAACRAHETELEDAYIRDPFAARLAGERGVAILNALPQANVLRFGLAIRTRFVDELLLEALTAPEHSIKTVLSVGCGLDTRPWRLDLAADLRWIEIDFADM